MVVLTDPMPGVRSVTLGFFYASGARAEPDELAGMSHFIEHCVFKGTKRRTAKQIANEQDRLGGSLEAYTTHEETSFAIKVIDEALPQGFDLLADMLTDPLFSPNDLLNEQKVIIEEMKMVEDSPEELLGDIFNAGAFPGDPLGRQIAGSPESVKSFDQDKTAAYHRVAFDPSNLVIAAAGNVDHNELLDLVGKYDRLTTSSRSKQSAARSIAEMSSPIIVEHRGDLEQAHLLIATPFVSATDERRYAADLLANMVGGGTSSRLWQKVREERGLAYSVGASYLAYEDIGLFAVSAATSPEQTGEVVDIVMDEMRWIAKNGITQDELDLAKDQTRASILLGLEDSAGRAAVLAHCEMTHGRQISVEETIEHVDGVTCDDVVELARKSFRSEKVAFAAIGDLDGLIIDRDRLSI